MPPRSDTGEDASPEASLTPRWARLLARYMDDAVTIPGTKIGIGLDSIIGFVLPGLGDALSAVSSIALLALAFQSRVPGVVMGRMVANVAIDALVGAVPFLGDLFDVGWKANRKNLELVERFARPGERPLPSDYLVVAVSVAAVLAVIALPAAVLIFVVAKVVGD